MSSETSNWLISWIKMDNFEPTLTFETHIQAVGWSLAMMAFGFLVLAFDTRPVQPRRTGAGLLRDRIAGLEQRYFLVVLNGILMYAALLYVFQSGPRS